jgi:hypothetical protein
MSNPSLRRRIRERRERNAKMYGGVRWVPVTWREFFRDLFARFRRD